MEAFTIPVTIFTYFSIGYWWGRWSWKVWQKKKRSVSALICFPVSCWDNKIGVNDETGTPPISQYENEHYYAAELGFFWPIKLLFNIPFLAVIGFLAMVNPDYVLSKTEPKQLLPIARVLPPKQP